MRKWEKLELPVDFHLGEIKKPDLCNIYLEGAELGKSILMPQAPAFTPGIGALLWCFQKAAGAAAEEIPHHTLDKMLFLCRRAVL